MQERYNILFEKDPDSYKKLTIEEIKEKFKELNITSIRIMDEELARVNDTIVHIIYTNTTNPITLEFGYSAKSGNILNINPKWYLENQELANSLIGYICENNEREILYINNSFLINDKLISSLCKNEHLRKIGLAESNKENSYKLSKKHYYMLKNSKINTVLTSGVEKELEETFDPLIDHNVKRDLIGYYSYNHIHSTADITLYLHTISKEEIDYFKYLSPNIELHFNIIDYSILLKVANKLKELNYNNKVTIKAADKNKLNEIIFNNTINYNNIFVESNSMTIPLKEYLKFEKQLHKIIEPAMNLSPFERYIYAYNKAKQFKEYKENEDDLSASRNLYKILENEFMVCVGFSNLFGDLLSKLGISSSSYSVGVDTSYDKAYMKQEQVEGVEKSTERVGHDRRYVYIKDEKYGIDGFYVSDPTWDNNLERDLYNHLAMTDEEMTKLTRYNWISTYEYKELFNIKSIEEFYQKINFYLSRKNSESLEYIIDNLLKYKLKKIDSNFYDQINKKYPYIEEYIDYWPKEISDLIYDIGEYILNHVNKEISGSTIIEAISNVYKYAYNYSDEDLLPTIQKIIEDNKNRQEKSFLKRYRTDSEGNQEVVMNEHNKFDFSQEDRSR